VCPYHAAVTLKTELPTRFGNKRKELPKDLPLFPNARGEWCTREAFVGTLARMAELAQVPTTDSLGRNTIGEHVWRISGARHLAEIGVPHPMIMLLARWGSAIIMRYIADAPLRKLTQTYTTLAASTAPVLPTGSDAIEDRVEESALPYDHDEALTLATTMIEAIENGDANVDDSGRFTYNSDTYFINIRARREGWERTIPGRANCGWDYRTQRGPILNVVPCCMHFLHVHLELLRNVVKICRLHLPSTEFVDKLTELARLSAA
jgi:hypothetical protein